MYVCLSVSISGIQVDTLLADIANTVALLKQKVAETAVLDKFGPAGLRIFRLLIAKHQLEQRQVRIFQSICVCMDLCVSVCLLVSVVFV